METFRFVWQQNIKEHGFLLFFIIFFSPLFKSLLPSENAVGSRNKPEVVYYTVTFRLLLSLITLENRSGMDVDLDEHILTRFTFEEEMQTNKQNQQLCFTLGGSWTAPHIQVNTMWIIQRNLFPSFVLCQRHEQGRLEHICSLKSRRKSLWTITGLMYEFMPKSCLVLFHKRF